MNESQKMRRIHVINLWLFIYNLYLSSVAYLKHFHKRIIFMTILVIIYCLTLLLKMCFRNYIFIQQMIFCLGTFRNFFCLQCSLLGIQPWIKQRKCCLQRLHILVGSNTWIKVKYVICQMVISFKEKNQKRQLFASKIFFKYLKNVFNL